MVNNQQLNATFSALADPTRRAIVARLARGEATVSELAEPFDVSLPAISKHLRALEKANLIGREKAGRVHHITLKVRPLREATDWITRYRRFWEQKLDALNAYLRRTQEEDKP